MSSIPRVTRKSSKRKSNHSNGPARKAFVLSDDASEQIPPLVATSIPLTISETDTEPLVIAMHQPPTQNNQSLNHQPPATDTQQPITDTETPANDPPVTDQSATDAEQLTTAESKIWLPDRVFQNEEELDEYLKEAKCWSKVKKRVPLNRGFKTLLRCNRVKRRNEQCSAGLYYLESPETAVIKLYKRNAEHTCTESNNKVTPKISDKVREFILNEYKLGWYLCLN